MSTRLVDLQALLADDPTFDENDEPLATQHHRDVIDSLYYLLRDRLAGPTFFVAAELRIYRTVKQIAAREFREPDLLVALDRPDGDRVIYLLSDEGKAPDFVLEVLSETTQALDVREKRRWYQGIGVQEYVVADPEGHFAGEQRLRRWQLRDAAGQEVDQPPATGREGEIVASAVLPYALVARDGWIRLVDPASGEELPLLREQLAQARAEAQLRREAQAHARDEVESRLAAEARQAEAEARQTAAEARQAEAETRAAAETAARLAAEQEIARLRQALAQLPRPDDTQRRDGEN